MWCSIATVTAQDTNDILIDMFTCLQGPKCPIWHSCIVLHKIFCKQTLFLSRVKTMMRVYFVKFFLNTEE